MRSRRGTATRQSGTSLSWVIHSAFMDAAMERDAIVVTGAGCVSALGHSVEEFWSALQNGSCGLRKFESPAPSDLRVQIVGAIPAPDPRDMLDARRLPMLDR